MIRLLFMLIMVSNLLYADEKSILSVTASGNKKISVNLRDADISEVIKAIANAFKYNVLIDDSVKGKTVTVQLKDVNLEDALDQIMEFQGLSYQILGNTIMVDTAKNVKETNKFKQVVRAALKYVDATQVKEYLKSIVSDENNIQIDKTTNEIIITDTSSQVRKVKKILEEIDQQPLQVMLEAKVVEVASRSLKELGFNWTAQAVVESSSLKFTSATSIGSSGFGQSLTVDSGTPISSIINFLEKEGKATIIANPRIATLNNKTATLDVVDKLPYAVKTISAGVETITMTYENVGVSLKITPQINDNDHITVNIKPKVSSLVEFTGPTNSFPRISSREVETLVRVKDGDTIVIGGLIKNEERTSVEKVPLLGYIPIIGFLFTNEKKELASIEVVILVTPKILK